MGQALFVAKQNRLSGRTEYRSRNTGIIYSVGPDLSVEAPNLTIISNSRRGLFSLIELADKHTG